MRFALHDGPGIRTTVFFKGCPLRCSWCHNPESLAPQPQILFQGERCLACGQCATVCPHGAIVLVNGVLITRRDLCAQCGACTLVCPAEARVRMGAAWGVAAVMAEVLKDRPFYEQSGGGITFSGGEPLQQPRFLEELLRACRRQGLHTAVDTCGHAPRAVVKRLAPWSDLWLFDLKILDAKKHRHYTGRDNRLILANLRYLLQSGQRVRVRLPLIPGVNDTAQEIDAIGAFLAASAPPEALHVLPYHNAGVEKYHRLHQHYQLSGSQPPAAAHIAEVVGRLQNYIDPVISGG